MSLVTSDHMIYLIILCGPLCSYVEVALNVWYRRQAIYIPQSMTDTVYNPYFNNTNKSDKLTTNTTIAPRLRVLLE